MQSFRAASTVARLAARPTTLAASAPRLGPASLRLISSSSRIEATPTSGHSSVEPPVQYPDYSKGPSALDKASSQFFFTEILRGEPNKPNSHPALIRGRSGCKRWNVLLLT